MLRPEELDFIGAFDQQHELSERTILETRLFLSQVAARQAERGGRIPGAKVADLGVESQSPAETPGEGLPGLGRGSDTSGPSPLARQRRFPSRLGGLQEEGVLDRPVDPFLDHVPAHVVVGTGPPRDRDGADIRLTGSVF